MVEGEMSSQPNKVTVIQKGVSSVELKQDKPPSEPPLPKATVTIIKENEQLNNKPSVRQDMEDLSLGADLLAAIKKGKGDYEGAKKWEEVAKAANKHVEKIPANPEVSNFSSEDGHRLTAVEQIDAILKQKPDVKIPKFSHEDGHELTDEERIEEYKWKYFR